MAELISKVARSAYRVDRNSSDPYPGQGSHSVHLSRSDNRTSTKKPQDSFFEGLNGPPLDLNSNKATAHITTSDCDQYQGEGILRTVMTFVERESEDQEDCCSKTSVGHTSSNAIIP